MGEIINKFISYQGEDGYTYQVTRETGGNLTCYKQQTPGYSWVSSTPCLADLEKYKKAVEKVTEETVEIIEISKILHIKNGVAEYLDMWNIWVKFNLEFQTYILDAYKAGKGERTPI